MKSMRVCDTTVCVCEECIGEGSVTLVKRMITGADAARVVWMEDTENAIPFLLSTIPELKPYVSLPLRAWVMAQ
jgi:hypothetical protein